ncbi:DUF4238 domain-containing protein [Cryobacterium ruanii]|uniref:DUF4238 domain-containing protein n=1 Tax=Cryobacterium ruanii TaxID=1259197 RepID=A0A4R9ART5_9MICO|nr:DUF4238 domain-containing protein [Cryobacterium ruanii]TFD68497.1 DUF4238 domain-containing protein [Cryobacterium ruanii]
MNGSGPEIVRKQHLISKVLLRRFARPNGDLLSFDLRYGKHPLTKNVSSIAWRQDFVAHLPNQAERLWESVEAQLPTALTAATDGSMTARDEDVLKQAIALHFFRRDATKLAFDASLIRSLSRPIADVSTDSVTGSDLGSQESLLRRHVVESSAEWFQECIEDLFRRGSKLIQTTELEVLTVSEGELLMSDQAVLSFTSDGGAGNLPFTEAATHLLPIGRQHAIAIAPKSGSVLLEQKFVEQLNRAQIGAAASHVYFHPESGLEEFVTSVRTEMIGG